ncbi:MAG: pilus assembly protein PilM [Lachnospiraceae bacterium]|nr:pilus assembly protein PilM [Lachnospiraceae bacterium]
MAISKVVSIEISDLRTRVCYIGYGKKNPVVYKSFTFDNPEMTVEDGFILERGLYGTELVERLEEAGIKCKDVVFSLTSNKIISREVTIPDMKPELVQELIENERAEYFPMDTTEYMLTYMVLEKLKETKELRILVYAVPDIVIKNYEALAAERDLRVVALDYNGNSIYQWLRQKTHDPMEMYLQVNEKNTMFTILENGLLALQRNMNFGTHVFTSNLMEEGYYGKPEEPQEAPSKAVETMDDAMVKLMENTLLYPSFTAVVDTVPTDEESARLHELKSRLTDAARPLIGNVERVLEYYHSKNREAEVSKIYLGGIGAHIQGLKELIESEFSGVEVVIVESLPGVKLHKKNMDMENKTSEYIACIGAAYPSLNFHVGDSKKALGVAIVFYLLALLVTIGASVFLVYNSYTEYQDALAKKESVKAQVEAAKAIEPLYNDYLTAQSAIAAIEEMAASSFQHGENINELLAQLEILLPKETLVHSLTINGETFSMSITVPAKTTAAQLLLQLQEVDYIGSVNIGSLTETTEEGATSKTVSFVISGTLAVPADEEAEVENNEVQ